MDAAGTIVRFVAENGKRYKVALYPDGDTFSARWVTVQIPGNFNRAGSWRSVSRVGPAGEAAVREAIRRQSQPE